jgi:hypothetical protein
MGEDQLVAAQMEFQARLRALHAAQGHLAELDALLRRFDIDRKAFGSTNTAERVGIEAQRDQTRSDVEQRRVAARAAQAALRQLTGPGAEPDDVGVGFDDQGFHQPPFAESQ